MLKRWQLWNRKAKTWLWCLVLLGVVAALPLGAMRMTMEASADTVEIVFDYRDIVEVAELQPNPQQFLDERLQAMKEAGVTTLAVYESSLRELQQAGRLVFYSEKEAALLKGVLPDERRNYTYILFNSAQDEQAVGPIVREAFDQRGVPYSDWSFGGRNGIVVEEPVQSAQLKTLDFDPLTLQQLRDEGFHILARLSDRVTPYDAARTEAQLERLSGYGVTRLLFEGDRAKGAMDQPESDSLDHFAGLMNRYGMGLAAIENLKVPQAGIHKLAFLTNYNVARLYSLSPEDAASMELEAIADRFVLAAKDRNIRMFFVNTGALSNLDAGTVVHSVDKMIGFMTGEEGIAAKLVQAGFPLGVAQAFESGGQPGWEKPVRGVVAVGAVAIISLLIAAFIPGVLIPVFAVGLVGSAGLYVLNSSLMEQGLALGAAVSGPSLALIWVMNRIYARTAGDRRMVGGEEWTVGRENAASASGSKLQWIFASPSIGKRIGSALAWFVMATAITLSAVPLVFGLLNNITYSLVLEQFRGVSVLHLAPIFIVALYVFLYEGSDGRGVVSRARTLLCLPVTVLAVVALAVLGAVGYYYLTRTGNAGQVSGIELLIRGWLESTFGVRPRFKEFMLGHPPLLLGLFLALRYRASWALIIVGALGQLTMVSTFTHIHTPLYISIVRTLLGLGAGVLIGLIAIAVWIVAEGAWRKWVQPTVRKLSES